MMRYDTRRSSSLIEMKNIKTAYKLYVKVFDLRLDLIFRSRMYSTRWRTFPETIFLLRLNGIFSYIALVHIYSFVSMFIFQVSGYLHICYEFRYFISILYRNLIKKSVFRNYNYKNIIININI